MESTTYQKTEWVYGVTTGSGSDLNSNDLLKEMKYPDKSSGDPSSSEKESYTVNNLGETKTVTDRNGSVHTLTYDVLGRLTMDAVTTLGSGVDGAVRRMETAYETAGRAYLFTSYDASTGGNIVNQVQREFNGLGQLTKEYQSHSGAVNTSTTPKVQYAWTEMASGANHSRLTSMTYPSGYVVNYNYSSGLDSTISRLSSLSDSTGTLESYDYRGLSTIVRRAHSQPGVDLTYIKQSGESNGDAGDQYTGHDRFGRIEHLRWLKTSSGTHTDRFGYGYDRNSNRLYRENAVDAAFSELTDYDLFNQLTDFQRGTLNSTKDAITGTPSRTQEWTHDALGNWSTLTTNGTAENRTHNKQNQVTGVGSATLTFDANGNLKTDETGQQYKYDDWNRLVEVKDSSNTVLATYKYDAIGRRTEEAKSSVTTDLYYTAGWQVLEEREGTLVRARHVWSPVYVDALVLRDRDVNGDGTLEERLWVQQDANWNVTALLDNSGNVAERYVYDPFGVVTVLAPNWTTRGTTSYDWRYLNQGLRHEWVTGNDHARNREVRSPLGRPLQVDPLGLRPDFNSYRWEGNTPINVTDPFGLQAGSPLPPGATWSSDGQLMYGPAPWNARPSGGEWRLGQWTAYGYFWDFRENLPGLSHFDYTMTYKMGCVGLCRIRLGCTKSFPHLIPDARCFLTPEAAIAYQRQLEKEGKRPVVVAVQTVDPLIDNNKLEIEPGLPGEFNTRRINLSQYNFATLLEVGGKQPDWYWEWINGGCSGNPNAVVIHSKTLDAAYGNVYYCVVPNPDPRYLPPKNTTDFGRWTGEGDPKKK